MVKKYIKHGWNHNTIFFSVQENLKLHTDMGETFWNYDWWKNTKVKYNSQRRKWEGQELQRMKSEQASLKKRIKWRN